MKYGGTITQSTDPAKLLRQAERALEEGLKEGVAIWHRTMMPDHFEQPAVRRYGYQKRSEKYQRFKRRHFGHNRPLVKTGQSEQKAKSTLSITSQRKEGLVKARATMKLDKYFYQRRGKAPDKPKELTVTTLDEQAFLQREVNKVVSAELGNVGGPQTIRV